MFDFFFFRDINKKMFFKLRCVRFGYIQSAIDASDISTGFFSFLLSFFIQSIAIRLAFFLT
jgi:hypothetical protein